MMTFRGAFGFLSNFHPSPVELDGIRYENAEAAFQAQKCEDPADRVAFAGLPAVKARQLGRRIALRKDWDEVRLATMEEVVRAKFAQNPDLAARLVATGSMPLVEGNTHGDTFWGVDARTGKGENHLGKILMQIREELWQNAEMDKGSCPFRVRLELPGTQIFHADTATASHSTQRKHP